MKISIHPSTVSEVAILEDEIKDVSIITDALDALGLAYCDPISHYKDFVRLIQHHPVAVVSIDWAIHGFFKGPDALALVRHEQSWAARVVYTQFANVQASAMTYQADFFVVKKENKEQREYIEALQQGMQLSVMRRIYFLLQQIGIEKVPSFAPPTSGPWEETLQNTLCLWAEYVLASHSLEEEQRQELRTLLEQWELLRRQQRASLGGVAR